MSSCLQNLWFFKILSWRGLQSISLALHACLVYRQGFCYNMICLCSCIKKLNLYLKLVLWINIISILWNKKNDKGRSVSYVKRGITGVLIEHKMFSIDMHCLVYFYIIFLVDESGLLFLYLFMSLLYAVETTRKKTWIEPYIWVSRWWGFYLHEVWQCVTG